MIRIRLCMCLWVTLIRNNVPQPTPQNRPFFDVYWLYGYLKFSLHPFFLRNIFLGLRMPSFPMTPYVVSQSPERPKYLAARFLVFNSHIVFSLNGYDKFDHIQRIQVEGCIRPDQRRVRGQIPGGASSIRQTSTIISINSCSNGSSMENASDFRSRLMACGCRAGKNRRWRWRPQKRA